MEIKGGSRAQRRIVYRPEDIAGLDYSSDLGDPGRFPYTRGPYAEMYRGRLWTMRQYAGYATAEESNRRYRYLLEQGTTGLSVAFDLPTQIGLDSDHPLAKGEVGRVGVAIDSLDDMRRLFEGIALDQVSTSMTINATAATLLALYLALARERGIPWDSLRGTVQNDILKEYIARGTYIYPLSPSMRLVTDLFCFCREQVPRWNTISISGYHIREAGATAAQELAFTIANGEAYVEAAQDRGLQLDEFAPQLSFFFAVHNDLFEEAAKFRAARRIWARRMSEKGARLPRSLMLRVHAQTAGSSLTAQQPDNNVVRVTLQALAAVLGGVQSLHTNARDEALALPTTHSAQLALRTQQIVAYESHVTDSADPLGGSWYVESLTNRLEEEAAAYLEKIASLGGMPAAIQNGFIQREIQNAAYAHQKRVESGEEVVVGANRFLEEESLPIQILRIDPAVEERQKEELRRRRRRRSSTAVEAALERLAHSAAASSNLIPPMIEAVQVEATVGEIAGVLREVFGEYQETVVL